MTSRPAIVQIQESEDEDQARVVITLSWDEGSFTGEAIGHAGTATRPRLIGEATLRAIEAVAGGRLDLILSSVATTALGDSQVALAEVILAGNKDRLLGSALLDEADPAAAVVRAILDALNRRLSQLL